MPNPIFPNFSGIVSETKPVIFGMADCSPQLSSFCSIKGRMCCLINCMGHGVGGFVKPIVYAVLAIAYGIFALLARGRGDHDRAKEYGWTALGNLASVFATPFTQPILSARAAFGFVFHPAIYFTNTQPFPKMKVQTESGTKLEVEYHPNETIAAFKERILKQIPEANKINLLHEGINLNENLTAETYQFSSISLLNLQIVERKNS